MDIFKLFFTHDRPLDSSPKDSSEEAGSALADFMKPSLTYSSFYLTGTRLENEGFGLNTLAKEDEIIDRLHNALKGELIHAASGTFNALSAAIGKTDIGGAVVAGKIAGDYDVDALYIDPESNAAHKKEEWGNILKTGAAVLYKEKAHHGYDLHLFSMKNIYPALFRAFQPLVDNSFRFFSINGKRMRSERHFYFETWSLNKPPHGAEEVFRETVL